MTIGEVVLKVVLIVLIVNSLGTIIEWIYSWHKGLIPEEEIRKDDGTWLIFRIIWIGCCAQALSTGKDFMIIFVTGIAWNSLFLLSIFLTPNEEKDLRLKIELIRRSILLLLLFAATGLN